jgi:4-amino-4-deoxy-L-arabinose transferase-like glycosyltransferase
MPALLSGRETIIWIGGFVLVSTLLVLTGFTSGDPDSALYAALSARLAEGPVSHWIAPEWWGHWDSEGLFREHPVGVLLLPTLLGAMGVPGVQAAYIVGIAAAVASLLIIAHLTARIRGPIEGRFALVLLQIMPVAFIFRIRANHEYPMLLCLLVTIIGIDGVRRSWRWLPVPAAALAAALLIKGVFVAIPILAAAIWILCNPRDVGGSAWRPIAACALAAVAMAGTAAGYDVLYFRVTGEPFWEAYWSRQLAPLALSAPIGGASTFLSHFGFYLLRLLWHPAPWSFALLAAVWTWRRDLGERWRAMPTGPRRALAFTILFAAASILLLSPASRFAERYAFSATYAVAAAGAAVAPSIWPALRHTITTLDRVIPALPAVFWMVLMVLRLTIGPYLPRIST